MHIVLVDHSLKTKIVPNWSEEVFVIKKAKSTVPWTYVISDLNVEEIVGTFYEKQLQKSNQKEFRVERVIKRKGDKLYLKWKGYDYYFKSWIHKKISFYKMIYLLEPHTHSKNEIEVELDLSNHSK